MALILRNGGSQSPDRWLREPRNNHRKGEDIADPWYTGNFDATYRDVKEGCEALLDECLLHL